MAAFTKNAISVTLRDRVKHTKIWDHKGYKSFRNRSNLVVGIIFYIEDISYIGFLNEMIYVFGTKTKGS